MLHCSACRLALSSSSAVKARRIGLRGIMREKNCAEASRTSVNRWLTALLLPLLLVIHFLLAEAARIICARCTMSPNSSSSSYARHSTTPCAHVAHNLFSSTLGMRASRCYSSTLPCCVSMIQLPSTHRLLLIFAWFLFFSCSVCLSFTHHSASSSQSGFFLTTATAAAAACMAMAIARCGRNRGSYQHDADIHTQK